MLEVVVVVVGVDVNVLVVMVVIELCRVLLIWLCVVVFGWVDCDGLECVE